jgi:hypothetical protein
MRTGGYLNTLGRDIHLSRRAANTMNLCKNHKPPDEAVMAALYEAHCAEGCAMCGEPARPNGTLKELTKALTTALRAAQSQSEVQPGCAMSMLTVQDCANYVYDLYVKAPLVGTVMETRALRDLNASLPGAMSGRSATPAEDYDYNVDIVFQKCGVQVKPDSFKRKCQKDPSVKRECERRNQLWGNPVMYLYYNSQTKLWCNLQQVADSIQRAAAAT